MTPLMIEKTPHHDHHMIYEENHTLKTLGFPRNRDQTEIPSRPFYSSQNTSSLSQNDTEIAFTCRKITLKGLINKYDFIA